MDVVEESDLTGTVTEVYAIALFTDRPGEPPSEEAFGKGDAKHLVVGVNFDGSITLGPGWDADSAAVQFWRKVAALVQETMAPLPQMQRQRGQQPS